MSLSLRRRALAVVIPLATTAQRRPSAPSVSTSEHRRITDRRARASVVCLHGERTLMLRQRPWEKYPFRRRWYGRMISTNLEVIWEMSIKNKEGGCHCP